MKHKKATNASACALACLSMVLSCAANVVAAEIDWSKVDTKNITTFYPGVASWEFMKDKDHGTGAGPVKGLKKTCVDCHVGKTGDYDINADKIISGELNKASSKKPLEPQPIAGAKGFKQVAMQTAYDATHIYMRLQWPGSGASVSDPALAKDDKADRISIQFADKIQTFRSYGCFVTCHDDQSGMPANRGDEVKLYGYYTRDKNTGAVSPQNKLDDFLAKGQFMDLWVVAFEGDKVTVSDQYILHDRVKDQQNDLSATGGFENGAYTVVISRKLATGDSNDIALADGAGFSIGIAIHDDKQTGRKHYTSFPVSIGLSTAADVTASKF